MYNTEDPCSRGGSRTLSASSRPGSGGGSRSLLALSTEFFRRVEAMRAVILCPFKLKDAQLPLSDSHILDGHIPGDLYDCFQMLLSLQLQIEEGSSEPQPEAQRCFMRPSESQPSIDSAYSSSTSSLDKLDTLSEFSEASQTATHSCDSFANAFSGSLLELCRCLRQAIQLCSLVERQYLQLLV